MTKEECVELMCELRHEDRYKVSISYYCYEWIVQITEKEPMMGVMYVSPKLSKVLGSYEYSIQTNGGGWQGMRLHVFKRQGGEL